MQTNEKLIDVLNDLIEINNDRVVGYEKAIETLEPVDIDLKAFFGKMIHQSEGYRNELASQVSNLGGKAAEGTTGLGKIYRAWMDVKAAFAVNDRQSALESCEGGEDAALKAYADALASDADMDVAVRQLLTTQQGELKTAHDQVKKYRDLHAAVNA